VGLLDRYLAREILLPFGAGLLFLTQLLLATQILAQAHILFGSGVALAHVGVVVLALLPHFLNFVLPVAFLLGAVLGVARLAEDREVVAMGGAGLSPVRLVRVPLLLALVVGALGTWLSLEVEPIGMRVVRARLTSIIKQNVTNDVRPGTFYDQIPGYTLYAEKVKGGRLENVLIHDENVLVQGRRGGAAVLALAREGRLEPVGAGEEMRLVLGGGEVHREELQSEEYTAAEFERAEVVIALGRALTERSKLASASREDTLEELQGKIAAAYQRNDLKHAWRQESHLHRRIASALAVIAFALLAVPLGASRWAGRAFGVGATFLLVIIHYLFLRSGQVMVQGGRLPAWIGLQLPNLVLGGVGLVLLAILARRGTGAVR
jgi:lipopolysaccharide export system permease protein